MQREIAFSGHENPTASASPSFTGDYDFAASLYRSIFQPKHSPLPDYSNEASSVSPSQKSDDAVALYLPQIQQQQLHQDLMERQQRVLSHLRDVAKQEQALRQENVNLKMANLDLKNRLNVLLNASFHGVELGSHLDSVVDGLQKMGFGVDQEWGTENEALAKSPTSVMGQGDSGGVERVHLPKSISVRSSGYLKAVRAGCSSVKGGDFVKSSSHNKFENGTQKVYVKGVQEEKQPLELEVYNQGMFKTELCNKWQQTGSCPYGNNCQFAHGIEELRPVLRHPRYKTEVCRMVLNGVPCPYGHRCHFRHSLTEQEQLMRATNSKPLDDPLNYR